MNKLTSILEKTWYAFQKSARGSNKKSDQTNRYEPVIEALEILYWSSFLIFLQANEDVVQAVEIMKNGRMKWQWLLSHIVEFTSGYSMFPSCFILWEFACKLCVSSNHDIKLTFIVKYFKSIYKKNSIRILMTILSKEEFRFIVRYNDALAVYDYILYYTYFSLLFCVKFWWI